MAARSRPRSGAWLWLVLAACFGAGVGGAVLLRSLRRPVGSVTPGAVTSGTVTSGTVTSGAVTSGAVTSGAVTSDSGAHTVAPPRAPLGFEQLARVDALVDEGDEKLRKERVGEAYELFLEASRIDPRDARPFVGLGDAHLAYFHQERAREAFEKALERDGTIWHAKVQLAKLLHDMNEFDAALALLARMEKENPNAPFVWAEIALNALSLGDAAKAVALLERYTRAKPKDAWGFAHLGKAYAEARETKKAEAAFRRALELDPRMQITHYWLGQLLVATGRAEAARAPLERYRRLRDLSTKLYELEIRLLRDPDNVLTLVKLAEARWKLGKRDKSLATLRNAMEIAPNDRKLAELYARLSRSAAQGGGLR